MTPGDIEDLLLAYEADVAVWTRTPDKYNYAEVVANRKKIADLLEARTPQEARGPFPDGDWLWGKLMDWCREHGAHPANYNDLFAIVDEARKARAANEPLTGIESLSGGNPGEKSACLPADNRGIAEAGSNPATHPDPKSGMSGAPGSGQHPDDDEESTRDCAERRSPAGTERTPAPDESNRHAPPPPDVQREVEMWRQVWDNVKLDVHNLREDNKPLAVAAAYALARADAERYRWLRERINWRDTVETSGELSCRYRIWEHRDYRRTYPKSETIDEAIDAARAAAAKGDDRG